MEWINYLVFLAVIVALPYPWRTAHTIWIVWMVTWALEWRWLNPKNYHFGRMQWPLVGLTLLFIWECLSLLWCDDPHLGWQVAQRHISLLVLLWISMVGINDKYKAEHFRPIWFIASIASVIIYKCMNLPESGIQEWGISGETKHKLFYCMNLTLAICSTPHLYSMMRKYMAKWLSILLLSSGNGILLAGIYLAGSRTSPVSLVCIFVAYLFFYTLVRFWKRHKLALLACYLAVIAILGAGAIAYINYYPRMETVSADPRMDEWSTVWKARDAYGLKGLGIGQQRAFLVEKYTEYGYDFCAQEKFSSHNAYLGYWMCLGPIAPLLLLACFCGLPFCFHGRARLYLLFVCMLYMLNMLTDDLFERIDPLLTFYVCLVIAMALTPLRYTKNT